MRLRYLLLLMPIPPMMTQDTSCHFGAAHDATAIPPPTIGANAPIWECRIRSVKPPGMGVCGGSMKPQQLEYFAEVQANTEIDACLLLNAQAQARGEQMPVCDECVDTTFNAPHAPMPGCDPTCAPGDASCCTLDCDSTCGC